MGNLHRKLAKHSDWYREWHKQPQHHVFHWVIFVLVGLVLTLAIVLRLNNYSIPYLSSRADFSGQPVSLGFIQGRKIDASGQSFTDPSAAISVNGLNASGLSADQYGIAAAAGDTVVNAAVPAGYTAAYSLCVNCTKHDPASYVSGSQVMVHVPPSPGYLDLWWKYTAQ